ncbi:MAG: tetratricopeptide repeat protein [Bacteroidales bacterium]|nr:tetratricopeptide repeat protein [Bacteroidales bacterium]
MKNYIVILLILTGLFSCNSKNEKTEVLVVGTIHASHSTNPNYTFKDIVNILGTYEPDVICVEIPPSYFRKRSYLYEMMIASMYGFENNKEVYPIDWWAKTDRAEKKRFLESEEYKDKEKRIKELVESDSVMQRFKRKYGGWNNVWRENNRGYEFYNGKVCNEFVRQMYSISMSVYGDSFMNLNYESRNSKMLELIDSAILKNPGKRIVVFTGCEHKHYFDIKLSEREDLNVVDFANILPLKEIKESDNIKDFLEKSLAKNYYEASDSSAIDLMYHGALVPLIHGMGMDDDPDIISAEDIVKTEPIIDEWEKYNPNSVYLHFEKGWIQFLNRDYEKAIATLQSVSDKLNEVPQSDHWFVKTFYYRNLGFCYDLIGEREKAITCYKKCKAVCKELEINDNYARTIYKNYELVPYSRSAN